MWREKKKRFLGLKSESNRIGNINKSMEDRFTFLSSRTTHTRESTRLSLVNCFAIETFFFLLFIFLCLIFLNEKKKLFMLRPDSRARNIEGKNCLLEPINAARLKASARADSSVVLPFFFLRFKTFKCYETT